MVHGHAAHSQHTAIFPRLNLKLNSRKMVNADSCASMQKDSHSINFFYYCDDENALKLEEIPREGLHLTYRQLFLFAPRIWPRWQNTSRRVLKGGNLEVHHASVEKRSLGQVRTSKVLLRGPRGRTGERTPWPATGSPRSCRTHLRTAGPPLK